MDPRFDHTREDGTHNWRVRPGLPEDLERIRAQVRQEAQTDVDVSGLLILLRNVNPDGETVEVLTREVKHYARIENGSTVYRTLDDAQCERNGGVVLGRTVDGGVRVLVPGPGGIGAQMREWDEFFLICEARARRHRLLPAEAATDL